MWCTSRCPRWGVAAKTSRSWWRIFSSKSPKKRGSEKSMRRRPWSSWQRPSGPETFASCTTLYGKTSPYRTAPSSRLISCSNRWAVVRLGYRLSTKRAMSSHAIICRKSCRSRPATSVRRRGWRNATAPTSTSCCRAISCFRTTSRRPEEFGDAGHHGPKLLFSQFWIDRQSQCLAGGAVGLGVGARLQPKIRKTLLAVERHRVIDLGADAALGQKFLESVPLMHANYVLIENVALAQQR